MVRPELGGYFPIIIHNRMTGRNWTSHFNCKPIYEIDKITFAFEEGYADWRDTMEWFDAFKCRKSKDNGLWTPRFSIGANFQFDAVTDAAGRVGRKYLWI
jgi:hypothetical protein